MADGEYSQVQQASATTPRSALDLLGLTYPFSQVSLLTSDEFAKQADRRRSRAAAGFPPINSQVLEEFHRHGILVPLFRIDLTDGDSGRRIDVSGSQTLRYVTSTVISELFYAASEGKLVDPSAECFQPWPNQRRRILWPSVDSGYLYSRHQLLGFDVASSIFAELRPTRIGEKAITWHLPDSAAPNQATRDALTSWRSLAIALCALDTYLWPMATRAVHHDFSAWRKAWLAFDANKMLSWLDLSPEQAITQANELKMSATFRDDTGDFYDLIRRAKSDAWDTMRGDALAALDFRLAADVLERCVQEIAPSGDTTPKPELPLSHQALSDRPHSLDSALTQMKLSPFPSLVIAVEGETEYRIVPRVMELLGIQLDRNYIEIVDFGGTTKDLALLARHAAEPVLGKNHGEWVVLDRPVTRFLVLTDAEKKYKTKADRQRQRKILLKSLAQNVPIECRKDLLGYRLRERTVEIRTWGPFPFEFAHFTDGVLADVLTKLAQAPYPDGRTALAARIHAERLSSSPDIERVGWPGRGRISKLDIADETWPLLERRIKRAVAKGHQGPPVMKAVLRAYEMANITPRGTVVLRRH